MTQGWDRVGDAVKTRMFELGITQAELARRSGASDVTVRKAMNGQPLGRADKIREIEDGLGWERGSIADLREGRDARVAEPPATDVQEAMTAQLGRIEDLLMELVQILGVRR